MHWPCICLLFLVFFPPPPPPTSLPFPSSQSVSFFVFFGYWICWSSVAAGYCLLVARSTVHSFAIVEKMFKLLIIMLKLIILFAFNLLSACLVRRLWFKTSGQIEFHLSWAYSEHPERFSSCSTINVSGICVVCVWMFFFPVLAQTVTASVYACTFYVYNLTKLVLFCFVLQRTDFQPTKSHQRNDI